MTHYAYIVFLAKLFLLLGAINGCCLASGLYNMCRGRPYNKQLNLSLACTALTMALAYWS